MSEWCAVIVWSCSRNMIHETFEINTQAHWWQKYQWQETRQWLMGWRQTVSQTAAQHINSERLAALVKTPFRPRIYRWFWWHALTQYWTPSLNYNPIECWEMSSWVRFECSPSAERHWIMLGRNSVSFHFRNTVMAEQKRVREREESRRIIK